MSMSNEYRLAMFMALHENEDIFMMVKRKLTEMDLSELKHKHLLYIVSSYPHKKDIRNFCKCSFGRSPSTLTKQQLIHTIDHFNIPYKKQDTVSILRRLECRKHLFSNRLQFSEDMSKLTFYIDDGIQKTIHIDGIYNNRLIMFITPTLIVYNDIEKETIDMELIQEFIMKNVY